MTTTPLSSLLTSRQLDIVKRIVAEFSTKEIALDLGISDKTVHYHIGQIRRRTGEQTNIGLVKRAIRDSLVQL